MTLKLDTNFPEFQELEYDTEETINAFIDWQREKSKLSLPTFATTEIIYTSQERQLAYCFLAAVAKRFQIPRQVLTLAGMAYRVLDSHRRLKLKDLESDIKTEH